MNQNNSDLNIPEGVQILIGIILFAIVLYVVISTTDSSYNLDPNIML